ncbi:MAG: serine hydrolase [Cephaloticoccus sp.]|nr:serine hydrolase [Cephaloticoccus sp.]MCF7761558.1 serine hydrolase [Cephaloticoccus sp.]
MQFLVLHLVLAISLAATATGQNISSQTTLENRDRFPCKDWMQYVDVAEAGFSAERLARAKTYWEHRDSSAFMAVSGGAVIASWGEVDRRFLCHSVRKSLLSALYGVYGEKIDLELTLGELGIDDEPALTQEEKQARIVDLLSARSGIYHEAAAASGEMIANRPARGSQPPGSFWWYNNWDFNAAGTVFEQLTGERIFEAFGKSIATPIGMQDYQVSDVYYHYEPAKSVHPGYMFRMSTRDLARFGLLFARGGKWQGRQIIPAAWVEESTRAHSAVDLGDNYGTGYGYMWWIEGTRGFTARGTGGHILAVYPALDLVMVIRADTYHGKSVPTRAAMKLFDMVAKAAMGRPAAVPHLVPVVPVERLSASFSSLTDTQLARYPGEFTMESGRKASVAIADGALILEYGTGTFRLWPVSETRFIAEDSENLVEFEFGADGRADQVWTEPLCYLEATDAVQRGDLAAATTWVRHAVEKFPESARAHFTLARILDGTGHPAEALTQVRKALELDPDLNGAAALRLQLQIGRYGWVIGMGILSLFSFLVYWYLRRRQAQTNL